MEIPLVNFDERKHHWDSVADEQLPLQSHKFNAESCELSVLDQLLLPHRTEFVPIRSLQDGFDAIKQMKVRGAPLIATVGMLTLLVDGHQNVGVSVETLETKCQFLLSARPTAINLANAFAELRQFVHQQMKEGADAVGLKKRVHEFVLGWQARERQANDLLLRNAVHGVLGAIPGNKQKLVAMTICNTGQLATSSYGTALGVILMLHRLGRLELALVLETRPYNQGSRLTAYELQQGKVPFRLIADSAAASAMRHFSVDVVLAGQRSVPGQWEKTGPISGADQVARNGDTANKIGTFSLSILAQQQGIPFFVVTPWESLNGRLHSGQGIRVEERPAEELTHWNGVPTSPANCPVWNPAFDITPGQKISGFLTERGNFRPDELANAINEQEEEEKK